MHLQSKLEYGACDWKVWVWVLGYRGSQRDCQDSRRDCIPVGCGLVLSPAVGMTARRLELDAAAAAAAEQQQVLHGAAAAVGGCVTASAAAAVDLGVAGVVAAQHVAGAAAGVSACGVAAGSCVV